MFSIAGYYELSDLVRLAIENPVWCDCDGGSLVIEKGHIYDLIVFSDTAEARIWN